MAKFEKAEKSGETQSLSKCEHCGYNYPPELVSPMYPYGIILCGECYRLLSNKIHGINREKLTGQRAEQLRLAALLFRNNSESKPR